MRGREKIINSFHSENIDEICRGFVLFVQIVMKDLFYEQKYFPTPQVEWAEIRRLFVNISPLMSPLQQA